MAAPKARQLVIQDKAHAVRYLPALYDYMRANSFDIRTPPAGQVGHGNLILKQEGQEAKDLVLPYPVLAELFRDLAGSETHLNDVPEPYKTYVKRYAETNPLVDENFNELRQIRDEADRQHPEKRRAHQAYSALPYAKQLRRATKNDIENLKTVILRKFEKNTLFFHECEIDGKKQKVIVIPPEENNGKPLYLVGDDIRYWKEEANLESLQSMQINQDSVYGPYFEHQQKTDSKFEKLFEAQCKRIKNARVTLEAADLNAQPNMLQAMANAQGLGAYQPMTIPLNSVQAIAAQAGWTVPAAPSAPDTTTGERYREITSDTNPQVKVRLRERGVSIQGDINPLNTEMAAKIVMAAGTPQKPVHAIIVRSPMNDPVALQTTCAAVIAAGGIPIVESQGNTHIAQATVINSLPPESQSALNNLIAQAPQKVKDFYAQKTGMAPAAPPEPAPPPGHAP